MENINAAYEIERLLLFGLKANLIEKLDMIPVRNELLGLLKINEPYDGEVHEENLESPAGILHKLLDYAAVQGILPDNTLTCRDLLDAKIMGLLMPRQSEVSQWFWNSAAKEGIEKATDKFYKLSQDSNYIRMDRIKKNLYWTGETEYGALEITINLSKPEKDPKEIEAAKNMPESNYPRCLLCLENVGYGGNLNHPARQNHRVIPLTLDNEAWYFQYSPYVYYNEHCIAFHENHIPMKISDKTFKRLFDFIELFPHYFIGSNADLPIVGGSILVHEHFQGGCHVFPMEEAPVEKEFAHKDFEDVRIGIVKWPMSVVRLSSRDKNKLIEMAAMILDNWREYNDEDVSIFSHTEIDDSKIPHNTITPIARRNKNGEYELDLVLRNNRTSDEHPDGIFHPHKELHHIKKENIGLIEVMGLAVLPGRLYDELDKIVPILTGECSDIDGIFEEYANLIKHSDWIYNLVEKYGTKLKKEEAVECLKREVANKFLHVLLDCGVFKRDQKGKNSFIKFMDSMSFKQV